MNNNDYNDDNYYDRVNNNYNPSYFISKVEN